MTVTRAGLHPYVIVCEWELTGAADVTATSTNLPNYGTNECGQAYYIKAAGYTNNGYSIEDGTVTGQALVWGGGGWVPAGRLETNPTSLVGMITPAAWTDDVVSGDGETWLRLNGQAFDPDQYPNINDIAAEGIATPKMTSNTAPSPVVFSSSGDYNSTFPPYLAFNQVNSATCWMSSSGSFGSASAGSIISGSAWLQADVGAGQTRKVTKLGLRTRGGSLTSSQNYSHPSTFKLQGSNNGTTFTNLLTVSGFTDWGTYSTPYTLRTWNISNPGAYRYYRLNITAMYNGIGSTASTCVMVGEMELYYNGVPDYGTNEYGQAYYIKALDTNAILHGTAASDEPNYDTGEIATPANSSTTTITHNLGSPLERLDVVVMIKGDTGVWQPAGTQQQMYAPTNYQYGFALQANNDNSFKLLAGNSGLLYMNSSGEWIDNVPKIRVLVWKRR
jgi:hypothetical protein